HLSQRVGKRAWLGKLENITVGHGVSLLQWRSGGENTPTIRRPTLSCRHQLLRIARREQGLARAGNARVRRAMIQLAWRFLMFQKESALALWYRARTADSRSGTRKTMIVALARKLVIALWRFVTTGETLEGVVLRPAS